MLASRRSLQCPRSPDRSLAAASRLYCQICWSPLVAKQKTTFPKSQQCLFCRNCLEFSRKKPKLSESQVKSPGGSDGRHLHSPGGSSFLDKPQIKEKKKLDVELKWTTTDSKRHSSQKGGPPKHQEHAQGKPLHGSFQAQNSEILLNESLKSHGHSGLFLQTTTESGDTKDTMTPRNNQLTSLNQRTFSQKLKTLDLRATRCGFCPREKRRSTLVAFCCKCNKHLCSRCHFVHSQEKLYKYHATVDLTSTANNALV